jgi:predicted  nucleic acid-binding Zn-ribbon protein
MLEQFETQKELALVFDGIESQLDRSLAAQKDAIERSLVEKVNREKEEAQKKVEAAEREFAEGKHILEKHKSALAELKAAKEQIQNQIKGHLDRAMSCRQMMEKMSSQAYEEFEKINHLGIELDGLRHRAEEETDRLRKHLDEKYGIKAQFQAAFEPGETAADLRQEMLKMKKVRELLEAGMEPAYSERPVVETRPEPHVDVRATETSALADFYAQEPATQDVETSAAEAEAEPEEPGDFEQEELRMLLDRLTQYRRTEPVFNGTEFAYFLKGKKMVLDSESFVGTVSKISDVARGLHLNLGQKEMSKDLFLIKQEILNQQEILRKAFLRVVRFCEKEDGALPQYISDVINVRILKDILERLTFGNWSNPADFNSFAEHANNLKIAFKVKVAPARDYLRSVLEQLEGGPDIMN